MGARSFAAFACLLVVLASSAGIARAQTPAPGPAVGEAAPPFVLVDQNGLSRSLESLLPGGDGKLAVVFYRSADW